MADDIYLEFASSGDVTQNITWDHGSSSGVDYHTFQLSTQQQFVEIDQQAGWGQWFISTADADGVREPQESPYCLTEWLANKRIQVTWKIGADTVVRPQFETNQTLDNTIDTSYRAINDDW